MEETINIETCYVCEKSEGELFRPCGTTTCTSRAHRACIELQSKAGKKCECQGPIVCIANKNFNLTKCCELYTKIFYAIFMVICGPISVILLSLGKTFIRPWITCPPGPPNYATCDDLGVLLIFISLPLGMMFYQFPPCCEYSIFCCGPLKQIIKWKSQLTTSILYLLSYGLVILAHGIGYGIIKSMFGIDEFFTWRTSMAGFVVYYIICATIIVVTIIICTCCCIYTSTVDNFTETNYDFGVVIDTTISDKSKLIQ